MRIIAVLLAIVALLLPFVGIGFADGPMTTPQKLLASGVLVIIACYWRSRHGSDPSDQARP